MSRRYCNYDNPIDIAHLYPSAIVCSCGDRFDSDWTSTASGSALWLYLAHKADAIASSSTTRMKPHRVICTLVSCVICFQSVGIDHYRAHLAQCRRDDAKQLAIIKYRRLAKNRSSIDDHSPSFECALCLDDDRFHRLDVGTMLEHRHTPGSPPVMELYVTCRLCSSGVAVDNALAHAAFAHGERLNTNAADMFFTAPRMQSLRRLGTTDDFSTINHDETPVVNCCQSLNLLEGPLPSECNAQNQIKREPSAGSPVNNQLRAAWEFTFTDYLAEECFSEQLVDALCDIADEPINEPPRQETLTNAKCSESSHIVTGMRREMALGSAQRPISRGARSGSVRESFQECDKYGQRFPKRRNLTTLQREQTSELLKKSVLVRECDNCGRRCSNELNLELHRKTHIVNLQIDGQRMFECDECGSTFSHGDNLQRHKSTHIGNLRKVCPDCGKSFAKSSYLNSHYRTHTCERPFVCSDCGKCFALKGNLNKHRRTHTGERPFVCSDCGKRFADNGNLNDHRRTHTGERPFVCSDCGKRFTQNGSLKNHRRTHTGELPFACSDCGKRFAENSNLKRHRRTHTGERPFVCSDCGKRFTKNGSLKSHRRAHTGDMPFVCSDCGKRFAHSSTLGMHRRRIHTS